MVGHGAIMTSYGGGGGDSRPAPSTGRSFSTSGRAGPLCRLSGWTLLSTPAVFSPPPQPPSVAHVAHGIQQLFNLADGDEDRLPALLRPPAPSTQQQPQLRAMSPPANDAATETATAPGGEQSLSGYTNRYPGYSSSSAASQPSERSSSLATSRVSSVSSVRSVDGEIDYKKLYEREKAENERLLKRIDDLETQMRRQKLSETQSENGINRRVGKVLQENGSSGVVVKSNSSSSLDEQERRGFERKIAELEDELQVVDQLRADNQRLKDENGALIRVISKLSK